MNDKVFDNPKLFKVWNWCRMKARHKAGDVYMDRTKVHLEKGLFIFGRKKAAEELGMPPSTVWGYMKILEADSYIDIFSTAKYSIITMKNVDSGLPTSTGTPTTNGQQMDTNNNVKNGKNVYISHQEKSRNKQKGKYPKKYEFNPYAGSQSPEPTEEEKEIFVPLLKAEYQGKLAEYMREHGTEKEKDIDCIKYEDDFEYVQRKLKEIRKDGKLCNEYIKRYKEGKKNA